MTLRDKVLLSIAAGASVIDELRLAGGIVPRAMKERYGFVPGQYTKRSHASTVSRLISSGHVKRKDVDDKPYLELTLKGSNKVKERFALEYKSATKWDGTFMFLTFDVPEKKRNVRDSLRNKIVELGFGQLQKSVWISPYHFEEDMWAYIKENGVDEYVHIFTGRQLFSADKTELAAKVWNLNKINNDYEKVIKLASKLLTKKNIQNSDKRKIANLFFDVLESDPKLPKELLPDSWGRERAAKAFDLIIG